MSALESKQMLKMSSFGTNTRTQTFAPLIIASSVMFCPKPCHTLIRRCFSSYPGHELLSVMPRLHQRNKLRATSCAQLDACCAQLVACCAQQAARNTQLVAGNKHHVARSKLLVARNKLRWCKRGIRSSARCDLSVTKNMLPTARFQSPAGKPEIPS